MIYTMRDYATSVASLAYITADSAETLAQAWSVHHRAMRGLPPPVSRRGYTAKRDERPPRPPFRLPATPSTDFDWFGRNTEIAQSPVIRISTVALGILTPATLTRPYFECAVLLARARHYAPLLLDPRHTCPPPPARALLPTLSRWCVMVRALPAPVPPHVSAALSAPEESSLLAAWLHLAARVDPYLTEMERD